jgi:hypothetical protein
MLGVALWLEKCAAATVVVVADSCDGEGKVVRYLFSLDRQQADADRDVAGHVLRRISQRGHASQRRLGVALAWRLGQGK